MQWRVRNLQVPDRDLHRRGSVRPHAVRFHQGLSRHPRLRQGAEAPIYKPPAIAIARAHRWKALLAQGRFKTIAELAEAVGIYRGYVRRLLSLTLLAPDITEAILAGNEPSGLSLVRLTKGMPVRWNEQRHVAASFSDSK